MSAEATAATAVTERDAPNNLARAGLIAMFTGVGVAHFVRPDGFEAIIPEPLPAKRFLVHASGVAELAAAVALAAKPNRLTRWFTIGLLLAVYPANINQAVRDVQIPGAPTVPRWVLFARLPLQLVMIRAAMAATRD
jgi:uncharacterized membrane protein